MQFKMFITSAKSLFTFHFNIFPSLPFPSLEPVLKVYQHNKQPEYIYQKNREHLLACGLLQPSADKRKWATPVASLTPLAELPEDFREKQVSNN